MTTPIVGFQKPHVRDQRGVPQIRRVPRVRPVRIPLRTKVRAWMDDGEPAEMVALAILLGTPTGAMFGVALRVMFR